MAYSDARCHQLQNVPSAQLEARNLRIGRDLPCHLDCPGSEQCLTISNLYELPLLYYCSIAEECPYKSVYTHSPVGTHNSLRCLVLPSF